MFTLNFATTLTTVSPSDKLIITTDSSCLGCGFSLLKVSDNLDLQPVWLESRVFSETERNAPIVLKEALGCLLAIRRWESYIRASQKPVLLLSDAISISYLKQNKNHSPKLAELANLLATMPNVLPVFLAGRYNVLADQLSGSVHKAAINEAAPDPSISELIVDVRTMMQSDISHLIPAAFHQYLLEDQQGELFDLLKKKRVFEIKNEHLRQFTNPSSHPAEAEFLFLLSKANNFDLSFLNLKILQDYLLELGKTRIPSKVLEEFIKHTKTKLSARVAQHLFPMDEQQVQNFVNRCRVNNCPNAHNELGKCMGEIHALQKQYNVELDTQGDWKQPKKVRKPVHPKWP